MSTRKPASLDGSLLARKGDAAPAISNDSPLLEELGEPRPDPAQDQTVGTAEALSPATEKGRGEAAEGGLSSRRSFGVIALVVGMVILFFVTFLALKQPPEESLMPGHGSIQTEPSEAIGSATAAPVVSVSDSSDQPTSRLPDDHSKKQETDSPKIAEASDGVKAPVAALQAPPSPPVETEEATVAVAAIPRPAMAKPTVRSGRYMLQLAAVPSERSARRELARLEKRLGGLLGGRKLVVVKAVPRGKPPVFRLRASSYETRGEARDACREIKKKKIACLVIRR